MITKTKVESVVLRSPHIDGDADGGHTYRSYQVRSRSVDNVVVIDAGAFVSLDDVIGDDTVVGYASTSNPIYREMRLLDLYGNHQCPVCQAATEAAVERLWTGRQSDSYDGAYSACSVIEVSNGNVNLKLTPTTYRWLLAQAQERGQNVQQYLEAQVESK